MKRGTPEHPKSLELQERLACSKREAVGILELLFHFTARYAPRGDVGRWSDARIATACDWPGEPSVLVDALVDSGWLDRDEAHRLLVHDFHDHADQAVKKALDRAGLDPASAFYRPGAPSRARDGAASGPSPDTVATESGTDPDGPTAPVRTPSGLPSPALPCPAPPSPARPARGRSPGPRAAAGNALLDPKLFPFLTALQRLHPRLGDVAAVGAALAELAHALPSPVEFASRLWLWANSEDWREEGGRFVPTAEKFVRDKRWKRSPRDRSAEEIDPGGWRRRAAVAEILGLPPGEVT